MSELTAEIDETGERIALHNTLWMDKPLITQIPGKTWDSKSGRWSLPLSWAACIQARALLGDRLKVGVKLGAWSRGEKARRDQVMQVRAARELVEDDSPDTEVLRGMREDV